MGVSVISGGGVCGATLTVTTGKVGPGNTGGSGDGTAGGGAGGG